MNKEEIQRITETVIEDYLATQEISIVITENTNLFGENSVVDSMGLVNIVIDLESAFLDSGYEISLTSDVAMSRRQSPFRSVATLVEFIEEQIHDNR